MSSLRSKKRKPTHPGEILREEVLPELGITQTEFAQRLKVSRRTVSQILHEHRSVTPDMAIRLAIFLGTTPTVWLNMQNAVDVWELENKFGHLYKNVAKNAA